MNNRKAAILIGFLFIITMVAGFLNINYLDPILKESINNVFSNQNLVITSVLLSLVLDLGIVGIALMFFPILKRFNETIALTYISLRIIECLLLLVEPFSSLFRLELSQLYINSSAQDLSYFQDLFTLTIKMTNYSNQIAMIILGIGSLFLCHLLFQSKLIPRFLAVWGFIGYLFLLASGLLDLFGIIDTTNGAGILLYIPGGIWEFIAFPLWLFIKGFNSSSIAVSSKKIAH